MELNFQLEKEKFYHNTKIIKSVIMSQKRIRIELLRETKKQ